MAYATIAQFVETYGLRELAELLCDEEGLITEALLKDAIAGDTSGHPQPDQQAIATGLQRATNTLARQSVVIDSSIGNRYTLPLANSESTPVQECCLALTRVALADDGDNISTSLKEERDYWRTWLRDIATGRASLPGESAQGVGGTEKRLKGTMPSGIDWSGY